MAYLTLSFLGGFQAILNDHPLTAFESNKGRALLAYLAVERTGMAHSRSSLAELLWPGYGEENARASLRQRLHHLRKSLGYYDRQATSAHETPELLLVTRQTVHFNPDADIWVDVTQFSNLLAQCSRHDHPHLATCKTCLPPMRQAIALYRGDFLAGFAVDDSVEFEEWRRNKQEELHIQALYLLSILTDAAEADGDYMAARQYARRQIDLEPWREAAHRRLMQILVQSGDSRGAIAQYHVCRQIVQQELGVEPEAETVALYEQIRQANPAESAWKVDRNNPVTTRTELHAQNGKLPNSKLPNGNVANGELINGQPAATPLPHAPPHSPLYHWDKMPIVHHFHGRSREVETLTNWVRDERCRLAVVLGIGGIGKSALVARTVRAVAGEFAGVIWSSLLNAPPPGELLRHWLRLLAPAPETTPPEDEAELLHLLLHSLRRHRYLLVLDNAESILRSTSEDDHHGAELVGALRPGYEGYAHLLQSLGQDNHPGCLLMTTRELPQALSNHRYQAPTVQLLSLAGLDVQAGQALLQTHGLAAGDLAALRLVEQYSGNPLALQIVANTVVDLYNGDIHAFTGEGAPVFDDIRTILDQQVARLSSLERELLFWLAIEREVVTPATLRSNLVDKGSQRTFVEALRGLQHRSLLEKAGNGFTLQNVIIEYLTDRLVEGVCAELVDEKTRDSALALATQPLLNHHALLKADAAESVRQSQVRLILRPVAERWLAKVGKTRLLQQARRWLDWLRRAETPHAGYAAGNLLNLLLYLNVDVTDLDFSGLAVWQAYLRGAYTPGLDLRHADLTGSVFTHRFGDIVALLFGADGDLSVAGIRDGALRIWGAVTGELRQECSLEGLRPVATGWSEDGRIAAVATADFVVHLFDVAAGRRLAQLSGPTNPIWRICFSADGGQVACGDTSGQVTVWSTSGQRLHSLRGHANAITALAFAMGSARQEYLASGGVDNIVCLWNTRSGEQIHRLEGHTSEVAALGFALDGAVLATASHDCSVRLWDVERGSVLHLLQRHTQLVRRIAVTPEGNLLATNSGDKLIYLWDAQSGEVRHLLGDHAVIVNRISFSPDGQKLATFDINGALCLWDVQSGQRLNAFPVYRNSIRSADISPDRREVVAGGSDGSLYLWDLGDSEPDDHHRTPTEGDHPQFAVALRARLPGHRHSLAAVGFSPDGETLASGDTGHTILLHNLRTQTRQTLLGHRSDIVSLAFNADGRLLASGSGDGAVLVWATAAGQKLHTLQGHSNAVLSCRFSPQGTLLASGSLDFTICLWNAEAGELLHTLHGHTNAVQSVAFSADGRCLYSSGFDQCIRVWDTESGQLLATWPTPNTVLLSLSVHPAGALMAAGAEDQMVYLLDLASGQVRSALPGHSDLVNSVKFSGDGRLLLSASADETVKLWQVDATSGRALSCQTLSPPGPYAGMKIAGVTGISAAQEAALKALGAVAG